MCIDAYAGGAGRGAASLLYRSRDEDFPDRAGRDLHTLGWTLRNLTPRPGDQRRGAQRSAAADGPPAGARGDARAAVRAAAVAGGEQG
jgi:hypothetical protein